MEDIRRLDQQIIRRELFRLDNFGCFSLVGLFLIPLTLEVSPAFMILLIPAGIMLYYSAIGKWTKKRWRNPKYHSLWEQCEDRLKRFEEVMVQMRKSQIADLQEMPKTIRRVSQSIYLALRRADVIANEVQRTEHGVYNAPPTWTAPSHDAQAKELYRLADKNIAEYKQQFAGVMAGVQRAEAQCAVFVTTLDFLRMKMIGRRLVGRSPEMTTHDFLDSLGEARLQLQAIDQALEELDFSTMPKTIVVVPPPSPVDAMDENRLGRQ